MFAHQVLPESVLAQFTLAQPGTQFLQGFVPLDRTGRAIQEQPTHGGIAFKVGDHGIEQFVRQGGMSGG